MYLPLSNFILHRISRDRSLSKVHNKFLKYQTKPPHTHPSNPKNTTSFCESLQALIVLYSTDLKAFLKVFVDFLEQLLVNSGTPALNDASRQGMLLFHHWKPHNSLLLTSGCTLPIWAADMVSRASSDLYLAQSTDLTSG